MKFVFNRCLSLSIANETDLPIFKRKQMERCWSRLPVDSSLGSENQVKVAEPVQFLILNGFRSKTYKQRDR